MGANIQPTLPFFLVQIVGLVCRWQLGLFCYEELAHSFLACPTEKHLCLWEGRQLVEYYPYSWWNDRWDMRFQTAEVQLTFTEVMDIVNEHFQQRVRFQSFCNVSADIGQPEGALLAALPTTMNPQGGPLSRQLLAVRAAAAHATDEVRRMIEDKQIEAVISAECLGHPEEINIGHAMEASRRVVHCARQMVTAP
ncbi:uncharacterized protein F5147DRAFT_655366 [Suillus discolor]|uniref:Uncharacterized protein n=1 Tax=Suillus discolor TaxID=1912936 RepID=A0A9P7JRB2_9AGAM|nr:uncharacterized protein F5147DRAFT_655366 [Suillus discolor]KAG2101394.1 hypothetical protein F5147DRAFT_655366 [Suillus discolor]